eukprot:8047094-Pyramimonas_sp.AAC.1
MKVTLKLPWTRGPCSNPSKSDVQERNLHGSSDSCSAPQKIYVRVRSKADNPRMSSSARLSLVRCRKATPFIGSSRTAVL